MKEGDTERGRQAGSNKQSTCKNNKQTVKCLTNETRKRQNCTHEDERKSRKKREQTAICIAQLSLSS